MVGVLAVCFVAIMSLIPTGPSSVPDLKAQGQKLVYAVERYRAEHGEYPPSLRAAGVSAPRTGYGRWQYGRDVGGGFYLKVGDYGRYQFLMKWDYRNKRWYIDT